jgi:hypothetical protein
MGFRSAKKCALAEVQLAASFSAESVDSTSLHELLSITHKIKPIGLKVRDNIFSSQATNQKVKNLLL